MHAKKSWLSTILWAVILLIVVAVGVDVCRSFHNIDTVSYNVWFRHSRYSRIRLGMTEHQVQSILGKPDKALLNPVYEMWRYRMSTPINGCDAKDVMFDPNGRVTRIMPYDADPYRQVWHGRAPAVGMTSTQVLELIGKPNTVIKKKDRCVVLWDYHLWNQATYIVGFDRYGRVLMP